MLGKLKSWSKGDGGSDQLVRANLQGSALPPELRERPNADDSMPVCSTAEMSSIASIHPEYQSEETQNQETPSAVVTRGSEKAYSLYDTLLGRKSSAEPVSQSPRPAQNHPSIADSLNHREASGHEDIQNLAEHYKGRSRRLAAARELNRASTSKERAEVLLDHQLMDIDSI